MNRSFSLTAVPPVVAVDVFNTAKLTAKIQELWKQVILNNSADIQTTCLLSQAFLYHSSSATMPLCLQTPLTDRLFGAPAPPCTTETPTTSVVPPEQKLAKDSFCFPSLQHSRLWKRRLFCLASLSSETVPGIASMPRKKSQLPNSCSTKGEVETALLSYARQYKCKGLGSSK